MSSALRALATAVTSAPIALAICTANVPTPPGCAVDQNLLARLETARVSQPEERGHAGERHRRRLAEVRLAGIRASSRAGAAT